LAINTVQILEAIQARLEGNASIVAKVPATRIGNFLKDNSSYPHILWDVDFADFGAKGEVGQEVEFQVDIWERKRGLKAVLEVADLVIAEFANAPVTIATGDGFSASYVNMETAIEPEGDVYRATVVFTLLFGEQL